jgi:hypothetical protein
MGVEVLNSYVIDAFAQQLLQ